MRSWPRTLAALASNLVALAMGAGVPAQDAWAATPVQEPPSFEARLAFRDGHLVVDAQRSVLALRGHAKVFEDCGLPAQAVQDQLVQRLDGLYAALGPVFERLAVPGIDTAAGDPAAAAQRAATLARLRALAQSDDATRRLQAMQGAWPEVKAALRSWRLAHAADQPPVFRAEPELSDLYKQARSLAGLLDSPLLPLARDRDDIDPGDFEAGRIVFVLAPPLVHTTGVLRPTSNQAQWDAVRAGLGDGALGPLRCHLWNRQPVIDALQDYLALRGLDAAPFRADRDNAARLGVADPPTEMAPEHHAGMSPERTRFPDQPAADGAAFGGRVLLLPDPLVRTLFIQTGQAEAGAATAPGAPPLPQRAPWRALYLLLPTEDFARVRAAPGRYLCSTVAVWRQEVQGQSRPAAVRLDVDRPPGNALAFAGLYLTQRELALRLRRLAAIGQRASVNFTTLHPAQRRRDTALIVEPLPPGEGRMAEDAIADAGASAADMLMPCPETGPAPEAGPPGTGPAAAPVASAAPGALPEDPRDGRNARGRRTADSAKPRLNELQFAFDKPAGMPAALGVLYTRAGLLPGDHVSIGLGQQRQGSAEGRYSSDFVAFDTLQRRLQLGVAVTRTPRPERPTGSGRNDELRDGAELAATLDLWRDMAGTFGQSRLALARARTTPAGALQALPEVTTLRSETTVVSERPLSAAAPYSEATVTLGWGRAAGRGFGVAGFELRHQRFVGAFERLDLHLAATGVGPQAPLPEWTAFGGDDTVRGWRDQALLARRSVALQAEFWMRSPWTPASGALAKVFRRDMALAVFADAGRVWDAAGSAPAGRRTLAGAGAGLRYTAAGATPVTLKFDVARPLAWGGQAPADERKMRVHLSATLQRSL